MRKKVPYRMSYKHYIIVILQVAPPVAKYLNESSIDKSDEADEISAASARIRLPMLLLPLIS